MFMSASFLLLKLTVLILRVFKLLPFFVAVNVNFQVDCQTIEQQGASSPQNAFREDNVKNKSSLSLTQVIVNLIACKGFREIGKSNPGSLNGFLQYLGKARKVVAVDIKIGSFTIKVECQSLKSLDELWDNFNTGQLNSMAQSYLVTGDVLKQFGLQSLKLTSNIDGFEYSAYRQHFSSINGRYYFLPNGKRATRNHPGMDVRGGL